MWQSLYSRIRFGFHRQKILIPALAVLFVISCLFVQPWRGENSNFTWYNGLNVVINLCTLGVAIMVWFASMRRDWEASLPKRLNAEFYYDGKLVMMAKNAPLTSEGDIRAWAQQLGAQMADTKFLGFQPRFETSSAIDHSTNGAYNVYRIKMFLSEIPDEIQKQLKLESAQKMKNPVIVMDAQSGNYDAELVDHPR